MLTDLEIIDIRTKCSEGVLRIPCELLLEFGKELLAAHSTGAQEPVAWMRTYRQFGDTQSAAPDAGYMVTSFHQNAEFASKYPDENTPLYARPQPTTQTDAARDAKRYRWLREQPYWPEENAINNGDDLDARIDAEIERLDRAKGE